MTESNEKRSMLPVFKGENKREPSKEPTGLRKLF